MARLLPFETDISLDSRDPKVIDLDGDEADEVFSALSSSTGRRALTALHEEPRTASALAEELDTTLQNVQYHLGKLSDAELIEVVDTWYSETGTEMKVYAPTDSALVLFAGEGSSSVLRDALSRLVGAVAVLGIASLLIDRLARRLVTPTVTDEEAAGEPMIAADSDDSAPAEEGDDAPSAGDGDDSEPDGGSDDAEAYDASDEEPEAAEEATEAATETVTETATPTETPAPESTPVPEGLDPVVAELYATAVEPGALFFLGGLAALALVAGWWYLNRPR